jgi:hypothetical protein
LNCLERSGEIRARVDFPINEVSIANIPIWVSNQHRFSAESFAIFSTGLRRRWRKKVALFTSERRCGDPFSERGRTHHSLIVEEDTKGEPRLPRLQLAPIARAREARVASGASSSGPSTAYAGF